MSIIAGIRALLTPVVVETQLIIDISKYQTTIKPELMPLVKGYILKGGQGNYSVDTTFAPKYTQLTTAQKRVSVYWWVDPIETWESQVLKILSVISGKPAIKTVVLDMEQQWADWAEWPNNITHLLSSKVISDCGRRMAQDLTLRGYKVVIYTRNSFMDSYSPDMKSWVYAYDLWLASYPTHATVTTWEAWVSQVLPAIRGYWPSFKGTKARLWQCSGDRDKLPGTYGATGGLSALDISLFSGTEAELDLWWGRTPIPPEPPIPPVPVPEPTITYILTIPYRNVRSGPGTSYPITGSLVFGQTFQINHIQGDWGRISEQHWTLISNGVRLVSSTTIYLPIIMK